MVDGEAAKDDINRDQIAAGAQQADLPAGKVAVKFENERFEVSDSDFVWREREA
jgi:hypothetical protein